MVLKWVRPLKNGVQAFDFHRSFDELNKNDKKLISTIAKLQKQKTIFSDDISIVI